MFGIRRFRLKKIEKIYVKLHHRSWFSTFSNSGTSRNETEESLKIWPKVPETAGELVELIKRRVIWMSGDYIVSVKPYYVSTYGVRKPTWKTVSERRSKLTQENTDTPPFDEWDEAELDGVPYEHEPQGLTLTSILPELQDAFGVEKLIISKTVPRLYEGPVVLSTNEKADDAFRKALVRAMRHLPFHQKMLYICVGKPKLSEGKDWVFTKMEYNERMDQYHYILQATPPSKRAERRDLGKRGLFYYRTLAYDAEADCSLVELEAKKMVFQLDRLFLLSQGCPVLGDAIHQKCNARILGQPVYVPPSKASIKSQYIPTGLLKRFGISLKEYHQLPLFAHVHTLILAKLIGATRKKRQDVEFQVPMSMYFLNALRRFDWLDIVKEDHMRNQGQSDDKNEKVVNS